MIETIEFNGHSYPKFQSNGNAARFCMPFALEVCKGEGLDVGCGKKEWAFPNAIEIDISFDNGWSANKLPPYKYDFIFSSHCLEHLEDWVSVLNHWNAHLKSGGTLFLYLPHYSQEYWRPWNNRKHVNIFTPEIIKDYLLSNGYKNVFVSERDLYHSFMAMGERK